MRRFAIIALLVPVVASAAPVTITARVVDAQGTPLPGAEGWAVFSSNALGDPASIGPAVADAEGLLTFEGVPFRPLDTPQGVVLLALRDGLAPGWARVTVPPGGGISAEVLCAPPAPLRGMIVDSDGHGLSARITPTAFTRTDIAQRDLRTVELPGTLSERLAVEAQAEGRFVLPLCPPGQTVAVDLEASNHGRSSVALSRDEQEPTVSLQPPGFLVARLVCPPAPRDASGVPLKVKGTTQPGGRGWVATAVTDARGLAELPPLQPGTVSLTAELPGDSPWRTAAARAIVRPGQETVAEITLEPTYPLSGRVVDAHSLEPVAGATVVATPVSGASQVTARADAEGRYEARCLPGGVSIRVADWPADYAEGDVSQTPAQVEVTPEGTVAPDIALKPKRGVSGIVVDGEGRPLPGAEVFTSPHLNEAAHCTDLGGRFRITVDARVGELSLWARCGDMMTVKPVRARVLPATLERLVVSANAACRMRVRAIDQHGAPVPEVVVAVYSAAANPFQEMAAGLTDDRGVLVTPPIWPDGSYSLTLRRPGYTGAKTGAWPAEPGAEHDFGDVILHAAECVVEGRVVDTEGRPVVGVRVAANREGPCEAETRADGEGRFRLEGLHSGSVWVTAQRPGAIGGVKLQTDGEPGTIVLRPLPRGHKLRPPAASTGNAETDRRLARELLLETERRFSGSPRYLDSLIYGWAMLDVKHAFELSEADGRRHDWGLIRHLAERLPATGPDEVLSRIESYPHPQGRVSAYVAAADRLRLAAAGLPKAAAAGLLSLARTAADRAVVDAAAVAHSPHQIELQAAAAEALYMLDPAAAEPVVRDLLQAASGLGTQEEDGRARGRAAEALCYADLEAALELTVGLDTLRHETTRLRDGAHFETTTTVIEGGARYRMGIARRIAATRPAEAVEVVQDCEATGQDEMLARLVYAMGPADPERALQLALSAPSPWVRARCLGCFALAVSPTKPDLAAEALEQALASLGDVVSDGAARAWHTGLARRAGELAAIAQRIGYPEVEPIAWLALANRSAAGGAMGYSDPARYAFLRGLALACPEMTAELIADIMNQPEEPGSALMVDTLSDVAVAAAVSDTGLAVEYLRSLQPGAGSDDQQQLRAWGRAIEFLLTAPESRFYRVLHLAGIEAFGVVSVD